MSVQDIVTLALTMGGDKGDEQLLIPLCQVAMDGLAGRLREGLAPEDCSPAFEIACAWMALDDLGCELGGVTSFTAGDISFHTEGGSTLRNRGERLMAPYLRERGFAFLEVNG